VYRQPASTDAAVITRLRQAGAVLLGTLNMDEFAAGGTGMNPHFGRSCNPWDLARITGGSSSGSAVAVAAGLVPVTLGSDTGGSARVPAAYCGVTAIKPSFGLVSLDGVFPRAPPFDSISPMGHSVEDCQTLLSVIAGGRVVGQPVLPDIDNALAQASSLRIGIALEQFTDAMDAAVMDNLENAVHALGRAASGRRKVQLPDLDLMTGLHQVVVKSEGARIHREVLRTRAGDISLAARGAIETGLFLDPNLASRALGVRTAILEHVLATAFADADVLLLPVTLSVAPRAQDVSQASASDILAFFAQSGRACRFVNYLGLPALSLPCGFVDGLPVGLQLVGRPNRELELFALGRAYQQMTDFHLRWPAA
jgi:aspartyl-tRNA(Asn)/glutamyl-tRNA(Gln) amidotransferase subunit A